MQRNRLKNIINKSKDISNPIGAFDKFKMSLPKNIQVDDNYRLESAWKAYGSPKNYQEALWQGLIQPIDENTVKLPSIGYNEETDEYEYLNKGRENETVNKDIRVWDNDVIPLVKELKLGGFIRVYDEEKDCWKYSKNKPQDVESFKSGGKKKIKIKTIWDDYIEVDSISDDQRAGRVPIGKRNGQDLYLNGDGMAAPLNHAPGKNENGGIIDSFQKGGPTKYTNGQKCETGECAQFSNGELRNSGYMTRGNAWNLQDVDLLYSGYNTDNYPQTYNLQDVVNYNNEASNNFYKNFDSKTLDKDSAYIVNMYYQGSPAQERAYNEGRDKMTGTHTGYVTWNPDTNRWEVTHNIHGTIHVDPFTQIQGGNKKYGITGIFTPRKNNLFNQLRSVLGLGEGGVIESEEVIDSFQKGGKSENKKETNDNISLEDFINQKIQERTESAIKKATTRKTGYKFKNKSWKNCIATATDNYGVPICLRNSDLAADPKKYGFEELQFGDNTDTLPDGVLIQDYNKPNDYTTPGHTIMLVGRTETGAPIYSYSSGSSDPSDMHNSTTNYFFDKWDDKVKPRAYRYIGTPAERAAWEEEYRTMYPEVEAFKQGGQMNVIPDGALHARKNNMEGAGEDFTHKGIPVMDNNGQQQAEIEREEIIYSKSVTDTIEKAYKEYQKTSNKEEQDKIAIKIGKFLTKEIIENTDDRTGLIEKVAEKNNLEHNK